MNFSHIEYGRARTRTRGTSHTTYTPSDSSRSSRSSRERPLSAYRSDISPSSSRSPRTPHPFFDQGRSRSSTTSLSSDDEPMFHLELSPPTVPTPEAPKVSPSFRLPIFFSASAMHVGAARVLGRPYRLDSMGKLSTFEPKGFDAKAPHAPTAIELVEEFGAYHVGTRLLREKLPGPIVELNRSLRGANSLALMLLFASGEVRASDAKDTILSKVDVFVSEVRLSQAPPRAPQQQPPPLPQFGDLKLT